MGGVILIEGLDLAGKSTLVRELATVMRSRGWRVTTSRNGLCPDNPTAALADTIRQDPERSVLEGAALYLAAHQWDLRNFRRPGPAGLHLQDSCWLRALAWDRTLGRPDLCRYWLEGRDLWPQFDRALVLTASLEERRQRYQGRAGNNLQDRMVFEEPDRFERLDRCLQEAAQEFYGAALLDTTGATVEEVREQALGLLGLQDRGRIPSRLKVAERPPLRPGLVAIG